MKRELTSFHTKLRKQMKRSGFKKPTLQEYIATINTKHRKPLKKRATGQISGNKRKGRTDRQKLEDKIWEECKRIIRKRYQNLDGTWTCYTTGRTIDEPAKCQTGHGKPKGALPVRFKYDLRNLRPQCYNANINLGGMTDIFIAKLEREKEGLEFLQEACVHIDGKWEVKQDQAMGSMEAFEFLQKLYEEYKGL